MGRFSVLLEQRNVIWLEAATELVNTFFCYLQCVGKKTEQNNENMCHFLDMEIFSKIRGLVEEL